MSKILIASTNLHLTDSLIINNQFNNDFSLVFIGARNIFFENIKHYFINTLHLKEDKSQKYISRIENAKKLINFSHRTNPDEIITGNDRKIETSILIKNYSCIYSYMDDGLHSYILEKNHLFKYTFFERKLREFLYKHRLALPKFIGCDSYIKNAYLYKPEHANVCIKNKNLIKLDIKHLKINFNLNLPAFKKLILLPHPKFINKQALNKIEQIIDNDTAIKAHPKDNNKYFNIVTIKNDIPLEILLLKINKNTKIYGFKTTAILIAKWFGFENIYTLFKDEFMQKNGIKVMS